MNKFSFALLCFATLMATSIVSCSDHDNTPSNSEGSEEEPNQTFETTIIGFKNVPDYLVAGPTSYGANLYYGDQHQITTGYLAQIFEDTYAQFSINYGYTYDADFNPVWAYSFYEGGMAVSKYHDNMDATYSNQLSVYPPLSQSGGNFVIAFGTAEDQNYQPVPNPDLAIYSDYASCGKVYITDDNGYSVKNPGEANSYVTGEEKKAYFNSVWVANTTYAYLTMRDGNLYSAALNTENKGWFKVQFIAFDSTDNNARPIGYVEQYLANFDTALESEAGFCGEILADWVKTDLSCLPECCVLVVNFVGSDTNEYGLLTPAYCALDYFEISVEIEENR